MTNDLDSDGPNAILGIFLIVAACIAILFKLSCQLLILTKFRLIF